MLHAVYPISKEALSIQGSGQLGLTCETLQDCTSRARRHGRYGFSFRDWYLRLSDSGSRRRRDCRHGGGSMGKQGDGSWASSPKAKLSASATVGAGSSPARNSGKATSGAGSRCREHPETGSPEGCISTSCTVSEREALGSSSQSFLGFMGHLPTGWSPPHLKIMHLWSPFWQFGSVQVPKLKP